MLKAKVNSVKKILEELDLKKEVKFFLVGINKEEDKVAVQHNRITIFKGSYSEYKMLFLEEGRKNGSIGPQDMVVQMDWKLRGSKF